MYPWHQFSASVLILDHELVQYKYKYPDGFNSAFQICHSHEMAVLGAGQKSLRWLNIHKPWENNQNKPSQKSLQGYRAEFRELTNLENAVV